MRSTRPIAKKHVGCGITFIQHMPNTNPTDTHNRPHDPFATELFTDPARAEAFLRQQFTQEETDLIEGNSRHW